MGEIKESSKRRCLMVGPIVFNYTIIELAVIVWPRANVYYEKIIFMVFIEIISDIIDWVSVRFLEEIGRRKSHCDDSICDISEI